MSRAEDIVEESLKLVLEPGVVIVRNSRPDFLRNPATGRNLEMDFYLPDFKVGIEVQGQHHYTDETQVARDLLKRRLGSQAGVRLIEISIFQISPTVLRTKLEGASRAQGLRIGLKNFDPSWLVFRKRVVEPYMTSIRSVYGDSDECLRPPSVVAHCALKDARSQKLKNSLFVVIEHKGKRLRARVLETAGRRLVVCPLGSSRIMNVKHNRVLEIH